MFFICFLVKLNWFIYLKTKALLIKISISCPVLTWTFESPEHLFHYLEERSLCSYCVYGKYNSILLEQVERDMFICIYTFVHVNEICVQTQTEDTCNVICSKTVTKKFVPLTIDCLAIIESLSLKNANKTDISTEDSFIAFMPTSSMTLPAKRTTDHD